MTSFVLRESPSQPQQLNGTTVKCITENYLWFKVSCTTKSITYHPIYYINLLKGILRSLAWRIILVFQKSTYTFTVPKGKRLDNYFIVIYGVNLEKSAKLLSLPTTCTRIARLHLSPFKSDTSQLNSPTDLSSVVVNLEINRETLCGVELTLKCCRKLELTGPACPFDEMPTIPSPLNCNTAESKLEDRL